jgi:hypothetical protein
MPTSEDYRQMANRAAQIAITYSAPSVAAALLGLALEYMALADGLISVGRYLRKSSNCKKCSKILLAMEISREGVLVFEQTKSDAFLTYVLRQP